MHDTTFPLLLKFWNQIQKLANCKPSQTFRHKNLIEYTNNWFQNHLYMYAIFFLIHGINAYPILITCWFWEYTWSYCKTNWTIFFTQQPIYGTLYFNLYITFQFQKECYPIGLMLIWNMTYICVMTPYTCSPYVMFQTSCYE